MLDENLYNRELHRKSGLFVTLGRCDKNKERNVKTNKTHFNICIIFLYKLIDATKNPAPALRYGKVVWL